MKRTAITAIPIFSLPFAPNHSMRSFQLFSCGWQRSPLWTGRSHWGLLRLALHSPQCQIPLSRWIFSREKKKRCKRQEKNVSEFEILLETDWVGTDPWMMRRCYFLGVFFKFRRAPPSFESQRNCLKQFAKDAYIKSQLGASTIHSGGICYLSIEISMKRSQSFHCVEGICVGSK
jgi:hypothetical protein